MANEIKRDLKNRKLFENEYQRTDTKHYGQYEYKYYDKDGKRRTVTSWRLTESDKVPQGKRDCVPLRVLEAQIEKDRLQSRDFFTGKNITINEMFDKYIASKTNIADSTRVNYTTCYDMWLRDDFGKRPIGSVKYSDVKTLYADFLKKGFKVNSIDNIHTLLHPVFTMAVRDGIINVNPSDNVIGELRKSRSWKKVNRVTLTEVQQERFETFLLEDESAIRWRVPFLLGLWTGCRVGETTGLRWEDIDFNENVVLVNHALSYRLGLDGKARFSCHNSKTEAGERKIPLSDSLKDILIEERKRQMKSGFCTTVIDGYSNFILMNRYHKPLNEECFNRALHRFIDRCNEDEIKKAKKEHREAVIIPQFSSHSLRHTYCTRLCEIEDNIGIIMAIMGHVDSSTTLEIYNEVQELKKKRSFAEIREKMNRKTKAESADSLPTVCRQLSSEL